MASRIHHLSCGSLSTYGGRLVSGRGDPWTRATFVCHCLLVEADVGLVLVDSGLGLEDVRDPKRRLGRPFVSLFHPRLVEEDTAVRQVERLGFRPEDVRDIVLTHLDPDHAGGLSDFPWATVHLHAAEQEAANRRTLWIERLRYRPVQWQHRPTWAPATADGERWFGFECVRALAGLPPEILLLPLSGHTRGHSAVAVLGQERWNVHAGDAYFDHHEMQPSPSSTPGLRLFQRVMAVDDRARVHNAARLRELTNHHPKEVATFCAHDPAEMPEHDSQADR
jgi:glyoxylase-like metal-dependent hydrolase (beta-lactamase superfamily II)